MTTWPSCPICAQKNAPASTRCSACGADLTDPDVLAMADGGAAAGRAATDAGPAPEAGALSASRFLWVSRDGLADGRALRRLALVGAALLLAGFVIPVAFQPDYGGSTRGTYLMSWELLDDGPALALLLPLIAGVLGLGLGLAAGLPPEARAGGLAGLGLLGLVLSLGQLGEPAGTPTRLATLLNLGVAIAGIGVAARVLEPRSRPARYAMIAGAAIAILGLVVPVGELTRVLPTEFAMYDKALDLDLSDASPLSALTGGVDRRVPLLLFLALFGLLPVVLLPAAAALAWRMPDEVWDKGALGLRPLAWLIVLYVPLGYGLYLFNVTGWPDEQATGFMMARARLLLLATGSALWLELAGLALFLRYTRSNPGHPSTPLADSLRSG